MSQKLVRLCPKCQSERPASESSCEGDFHGRSCDWNLLDLPLLLEGSSTSQSVSRTEANNAAQNLPSLSVSTSFCQNGHALDAGDLICLICGAGLSSTPGRNIVDNASEESQGTQQIIGEWRILSILPSRSKHSTRYRVERIDGSSSMPYVMVLYKLGVEPERTVYPMLAKMPERSVSMLVAEGIDSGCAFEIWHEWSEKTLEDLISSKLSSLTLRALVESLGPLLANLSISGLRHRDLRPCNISVCSENPLQLSINGFSSALLSDFDLEVVSPLDSTRYTAPETLGGGVSSASDWWSLGMILLEIATNGKCFEGVNENAFLIHVVTTGVALPPELNRADRALLRGLLDRNPHKRWQWRELKNWLEGEFEETADENERIAESDDGAIITLSGKAYRKPERFALAAAEAQHWNEASSLLLRGVLCTWLEEISADPDILAAVRNVLADVSLDDDLKLAFVLIYLNSNMPFSLRGEIVNPAWLLSNAESASSLLHSAVAKRFRQMDREAWLQKLSERADSTKKRIAECDLSHDEERLQVALLSTSKRNLESEWSRKRAIFPDSEHELILSLLERKNLSEEDLIILLSATPSNFILAEQVIEKANKLASQVKGIKIESATASSFLSLSRSQIYEEIDARIAGFARCGLDAVDSWADTYRLEKRISLERCLVLLAVPKELWKEPAKQQYITEILKFGERRIMATINQGPLVLLRISRSSSTLDISELGTARLTADKILERLLARNSQSIELDPEVFDAIPTLERRVRGLVQKTTIFRRDTGKHGLFLGFPFVVMKSRATDENKTKLRVAPILLFPVRIDTQIGTRGKVTIASSPDSDEVRLNPALAGILNLTAKDEERWKEALDEIMSRSTITPRDLIDVFRQLCPTKDTRLQNVPGKDVVAELGKAFLSYSAALFHCDFAGKAVADDLRNICGRPITGTALELALRVTNERENEPSDESTASPSFDVADYSVIAADPSQEIAVQQSRLSQGLHIEGPPGTGKSQTIVNIIADCIARNETALVICQKQAALSVVEKRLKAEGLGKRLFYITDVSKDRQSVIRQLREQLEERSAGHGAPLVQIRKERSSLMNRLQSIDGELNKHHSAVHNIYEEIGLSYRSILSELIKLESAESDPIKLPRLRTILKDDDNASVSALAEECASIAKLWLESKFENSPLQDLKLFSPDDADAILIKDEFARFVQAEEFRYKTLSDYPKSADVDDITVYVSWLKENEDYIRDIQKDVRVNLSKWVSNFFPDESSSSSAGSDAILTLRHISEALSELNKSDYSAQLFAPIAELAQDALRKKIAMAKSATSVGGFFTQINPVRALNRLQLRNYLNSLEYPSGDKGMLEFLRAAMLEKDMRRSRQQFEEVCRLLRVESSNMPLDLEKLQNAVSILLSQLTPVAELSSKLRSCPLPTDARDFAKRAEPAAFDEFSTLLKGVIKRHAAKTDCLNKLNRLADWFDDEWMQAQKKVISAGRGNIEAVRHLQRALQTLVPYQEFRLRAKSLSSKAMEIFAALREREDELIPYSESDLGTRIRMFIRREACLSWKSQLETKEPALTIPKDEINYKVKSLAESDEHLRRLNRQILAEPAPEATIAPARKWEDITRLSGARARRLRELVSNGEELGLMKLRPVWLMNPETASRLLPLTAGLFDAVIFDEASQLLVEYALPTLFRAKRAIVSGDEKQMPPPTFFAAKVQNDEALDLDEDELDELLPQAERDRIEEAWNRREIKDCPDMLNLASAVLPSRPLQIHYRSEYRELIAFSNSAFYAGTLSIPTKRPANEVRKARPIEVYNVNSAYEKQVNRGEALKVVEILQKFWSVPQAERPTIGIVSFNLKQADLIEEVLEDFALRDDSFKAAFEEETNRFEDGEDVGFFVKNLENVQGDERDIIIFSTTFGKDSTGLFRRNFGKLGQQGGERRLNVAITRAKRKVILVTSLPNEKISDFLTRGGSPSIPRDYVQAYMDYAAKISSGSLDAAEHALGRLSATQGHRSHFDAAPQDAFINDVAAYIRSLGYEPVLRQRDENDAFNIDIAIEDPKTGLFGIGIECDAPRHKILTSAKHREIWRQAVLSKSIAKIHRINSREWYQKRDKEKELLRDAIVEALRSGEPS